ncbi:MAG: MoxR family ATPase [Thermoguttaceae bacterium]|nr:MoxR family ATPase [Thermoguttaceae bacterium]
MADMSNSVQSSTPRWNAVQISQMVKKLIANVELVVIGKRKQVVLAITAWLSEGHVLLEDVPGTAKTVMARALAASVGATFRRVQCTPDLLPTDITGASVFNAKTTEFEFRPGPLFTNILLADEINRATPRTQAALLEAMAEQRVSADGVTYDLQKPFIVVATQNPIDHEGTFPLPEAQLDRFLMKFGIGYPSFDDELRMLDRLQHRHPIDSLQAVVTVAELRAAQTACREVFVHELVRRYITEIVHATRQHEDVRLGGGPRATLALFRSSQALAAISARDYVLPDDVKRVVSAVLIHRLILKPEARLRKVQATDILAEIMEHTPAPVMQAEA